eukprot:2816948-Amphidinium_carterae.1
MASGHLFRLVWSSTVDHDPDTGLRGNRDFLPVFSTSFKGLTFWERFKEDKVQQDGIQNNSDNDADENKPNIHDALHSVRSEPCCIDNVARRALKLCCVLLKESKEAGIPNLCAFGHPLP